VVAPTRFGITLLSSGSVLVPSERCSMEEEKNKKKKKKKEDDYDDEHDDDDDINDDNIFIVRKPRSRFLTIFVRNG
jgi:hypothetical protein